MPVLTVRLLSSEAASPKVILLSVVERVAVPAIAPMVTAPE